MEAGKYLGEKVGIPLGIWIITSGAAQAFKKYGDISMIKSIFQTFVVGLWPMWVGVVAIVFYLLIRFQVDIYKAWGKSEIFQKETLDYFKMLQKDFRSDPQLRILLINSAQYGAQGVTKDVTDILQSKIVSGRVEHFPVTNETLGPDPAKGFGKVLSVKYTYCGEVRSKEIQEGGILSLPE